MGILKCCPIVELKYLNLSLSISFVAVFSNIFFLAYEIIFQISACCVYPKWSSASSMVAYAFPMLILSFLNSEHILFLRINSGRDIVDDTD